MNIGSDIAEVITWLAVINAAALVVLVVLSFIGGVLILNGLEALDRRLRDTQRRRIEKLEREGIVSR